MEALLYDFVFLRTKSINLILYMHRKLRNASSTTHFTFQKWDTFITKVPGVFFFFFISDKKRIANIYYIGLIIELPAFYGPFETGNKKSHNAYGESTLWRTRFWVDYTIEKGLGEYWSYIHSLNVSFPALTLTLQWNRITKINIRVWDRNFAKHGCK